MCQQTPSTTGGFESLRCKSSEAIACSGDRARGIVNLCSPSRVAVTCVLMYQTHVVNTGVVEQGRQNQDVAIEAEEAGEYRYDEGPVRCRVVRVPGEAVYRVGSNRDNCSSSLFLCKSEIWISKGIGSEEVILAERTF